MTVAAIDTVVTYNENGSSKAFAVPFQFIAAADLIVERFDTAGTRTLLVLGSDYTVSGGGGGVALLGGTVTTTVAKPAGWQIKISRSTPRTQPANYTPGDTFPAEMHERALDREMLCICELDDQLQEDEDEFAALLARVLRVPVGETINELPSMSLRALKLLGFDYAGNLLLHDLAELKGAKGDTGDRGAPGGNAMSIGLGDVNIATTNLNSGPLASSTTYRTDGFYAAGDGGGAFYYRSGGAAQPGDQLSADGVRLSLSLGQQLTFKMLGAKSTGGIFVGSITGATMVFTATQSSSGTLFAGDTVTAAGSSTAVLPGTKVTVGGTGSTFTIDPPQTVPAGTVLVINDCSPYLPDAMKLGPLGLLFTTQHWSARAIPLQGYPVKWFGPSGYGGGNVPFPAKICVPAGFSALIAAAANATISPEGDVGLTGSVPFGGVAGWSIERMAFQVGNGGLPAATVNNRDTIGIYRTGAIDNFQVFGGDGDGVRIFGDAPSSLSDKCLIRKFPDPECLGQWIPVARWRCQHLPGRERRYRKRRQVG